MALYFSVYRVFVYGENKVTKGHSVYWLSFLVSFVRIGGQHSAVASTPASEHSYMDSISLVPKSFQRKVAEVNRQHFWI